MLLKLKSQRLAWPNYYSIHHLPSPYEQLHIIDEVYLCVNDTEWEVGRTLTELCQKKLRALAKWRLELVQNTGHRDVHVTGAAGARPCTYYIFFSPCVLGMTGLKPWLCQAVPVTSGMELTCPHHSLPICQMFIERIAALVALFLFIIPKLFASKENAQQSNRFRINCHEGLQHLNRNRFKCH